MIVGDLAGLLLVATPALADPNFDGTVVLVLAHDPDEGALGVVLNRPSDTDVGDPLPHWRRLATEPGVVFVGGPVGEGAAIGLARARSGTGLEDWSPVVGRVGTVDLGRDPDDVFPAVQDVRVFAGYAGWGPGQIEAEILEGAWVVVPAEADDVLSVNPGRLWQQVLRRQPDQRAWLAHFPEDPKLN